MAHFFHKLPLIPHLKCYQKHRIILLDRKFCDFASVFLCIVHNEAFVSKFIVPGDMTNVLFSSNMLLPLLGYKIQHIELLLYLYAGYAQA